MCVHLYNHLSALQERRPTDNEKLLCQAQPNLRGTAWFILFQYIHAKWIMHKPSNWTVVYIPILNLQLLVLQQLYLDMQDKGHQSFKTLSSCPYHPSSGRMFISVCRHWCYGLDISPHLYCCIIIDALTPSKKDQLYIYSVNKTKLESHI